MKEAQTGLHFSQNGKTSTSNIKVRVRKSILEKKKKAPKHLSHSDLCKLKMTEGAVSQRDTCGATRLHSMCRSACDSSE